MRTSPYIANVLKLGNIKKSFHSQIALQDVSMNIAEGQFISLLGPSGCGKTTLLRIIAGLESADEGQITWKGHPIQTLTARERPFNMVFQNYALFPHLNVFENIAFGLRLKKMANHEVSSRVNECLELVGLEEFAKRNPSTLSGGQQQRVALARALVNKPEILLLDEPLSALDQQLRIRMQTELKLLQRKLGLTFILVTHDQEEAMAVSDQIAVINKGRLEQFSTPQDLYENPQCYFTASFIGRTNWIHCHSEKTNIKGHARESLRGHQISVFIRPEKIRISQNGSSNDWNRIQGRSVQSVFRGTYFENWVDLGNKNLIHFQSASSPQWKLQETIDIEFPVSDTLLFNSITEATDPSWKNHS